MTPSLCVVPACAGRCQLRNLRSGSGNREGSILELPIGEDGSCEVRTRTARALHRVVTVAQPSKGPLCAIKICSLFKSVDSISTPVLFTAADDHPVIARIHVDDITAVPSQNRMAQNCFCDVSLELNLAFSDIPGRNCV